MTWWRAWSLIHFAARPQDKATLPGRTVMVATIPSKHLPIIIIIDAAVLFNTHRRHPRFESAASYILKKFFYACFDGRSKLQDLRRTVAAATGVTPGIQVVPV